MCVSGRYRYLKGRQIWVGTSISIDTYGHEFSFIVFCGMILNC